jgi:hypothetical protein
MTTVIELNHFYTEQELEELGYKWVASYGQGRIYKFGDDRIIANHKKAGWQIKYQYTVENGVVKLK